MSLSARIGESVQTLAQVFRSPDLRRLQLAWIGSVIGNWSYLIALSVYAYDQGGPTAVGIVLLARMIPAAVAAPFVSTVADRYSRKLVMFASDVLRGVLMVLAAVTIMVDGPAPIVYVIVAVSTMVGTVFRPAQAALLPSLARTPGELTAANVASATVESIAIFIGPALGGVLLAVSNVETVFAVNAATFVWSAALVLRISASGAPTPGDQPVTRRRGHGLTAGFRAIGSNRDLFVLCSLYTGQTLVAGALNVLVVVTALELLELDEAGVGYLNAALGAGGLVGGFVALVLATRGRLAADFGLGVALYSLPLVAVGLVSSTPVTIFALAVIGLGNSLVDINAITIMQRTVPDEVLARVLGVLSGLLYGSMGVGAMLAPLLIELTGVRTALVATGVLLPVFALLAAARLRSIDLRSAPPVELSLLRRVDLLAPLPPATLQHLAGTLTEVRAEAGETVIRAGDPGDRYYVIAEGEVEIEGRRFGPGEGFGEIALLRDVPRTATVTAVTPVRLHALEREEFISAVTGHEPAHAAAESVVAARLGSFDVGIGSV